MLCTSRRNLMPLLISIFMAICIISTHLSIDISRILTESNKETAKTEPIIRNATQGLKLQVSSRAFKSWEGMKIPCYADYLNKPKFKRRDLKGLLFLKSRKTASSTLAGINLRISHRHSNEEGKMCANIHSHNRAHKLNLSKRKQLESFLWTFVRDPTSQFLSQFFHFEVSRKGVKPSYNSFIKYSNYEFSKDDLFPQLSVISPVKLSISDIQNNGAKIVDSILNAYDFIGVTERLDESLVVLRLLLGLDAGDILYLSSKINGGYDGGGKKKKCYFIQPSVTSPEVKEYLSSEDWNKKIKVIAMLHKAVNETLDRTIQTVIGQSKFDEALSEHRYLQSLVHKVCAPTANFPCSKDGILQKELSKKNCYDGDLGCGYPCIDELYKNITARKIAP